MSEKLPDTLFIRRRGGLPELWITPGWVVSEDGIVAASGGENDVEVGVYKLDRTVRVTRTTTTLVTEVAK